MVELLRKCNFLKVKNLFVILLCIILSTIGMIISLYEPMVLGKLIDCISNNYLYFLDNLILYAVCTVLGIIIISYCRYLINRVNLKLISQLRIFFYRSVVTSKVTEFQNVMPGDLISKFETDISIVSSFVSGNFVSFIVNAISTVVIIVYMGKIDWRLTLFLLILVPIDIMMVKKLGKYIAKYANSARKSNSIYLSFFEETIKGLKDIKSYEIEHQFICKMKKFQDEYSDQTSKVWTIELLVNVLNKIFLIAVNIIIIFQYSKYSLQSVGVFIAYINYTGKLYSSLFGLSDIYAKWKSVSISLQRISDVLNFEEEQLDKGEPANYRGEIQFRDIFFKYPLGNWSLEKFNARILPNGINIIIGESGSGKTSICELLLSFYDIIEGDILINGDSLRSLNRKSLRNRISYVSQTTYFFDMNPFEYLKIGNPMLNKVDAANILCALGLNQLAENVIGENHESTQLKLQDLSVGQKQRLSIARGLIKNADIYIFDEPTSALDSESKKYVLSAINDLCDHATVILITHDIDVIEYYPQKNLIYVEH